MAAKDPTKATAQTSEQAGSDVHGLACVDMKLASARLASVQHYKNKAVQYAQGIYTHSPASNTWPAKSTNGSAVA